MSRETRRDRGLGERERTYGTRQGTKVQLLSIPWSVDTRSVQHPLKVRKQVR